MMKRTKREMKHLLLAIMACTVGLLLASGLPANGHPHETPSESGDHKHDPQHEPHVLQPRPHTHPELDPVRHSHDPVEHSHDAEDREPSQPVSGERKYPIEPGERSSENEQPKPWQTEYYEIQDKKDSMPFYCPALREPVLKVEKPDWVEEFDLGGDRKIAYDIKVTNITTNQWVVDLEVHEILPPIDNFVFDTAIFQDAAPDSVPTQESLTTFVQGSGTHQAVVFSWKDRNRLLAPGESRTITIVGQAVGEEGELKVSPTGIVTLPIKFDEPFYTAVDYMLGGCKPLRAGIEEVSPTLGVRGDFHDMVDPVVASGGQVVIRHLAVVRNQGTQTVELSKFVYDPLNQVTLHPEGKLAPMSVPGLIGKNEIRVRDVNQACALLSKLEGISDNDNLSLDEKRTQRTGAFEDVYGGIVHQDISGVPPVVLPSDNCVEILFKSTVGEQDLTRYLRQENLQVTAIQLTPSRSLLSPLTHSLFSVEARPENAAAAQPAIVGDTEPTTLILRTTP